METRTKHKVSQAEAAWWKVLKGDMETFRDVVDPHLSEITEAARRELEYYVSAGDLPPGDVEPDDVVAETLWRAWKSKQHRPAHLGIRAWLLGLEYQVMQRIARAEKEFLDIATVSLESTVPQPPDDAEDEFWEWYQPDDLLKWEDVIPEDVVHPQEARREIESKASKLDARSRQAVLLHELHGLSMPEIATILGMTVRQAEETVDRGRVRLGIEKRLAN